MDLDIDRQSVTCQGTPKQIDQLIHDEVEALACPDGGLTMILACIPNPLKCESGYGRHGALCAVVLTAGGLPAFSVGHRQARPWKPSRNMIILYS